jgi:hypothetical protein
MGANKEVQGRCSGRLAKCELAFGSAVPVSSALLLPPLPDVGAHTRPETLLLGYEQEAEIHHRRHGQQPPDRLR